MAGDDKKIRTGAAIGFGAFASFALIEGWILFHAYPAWYPSSLSWLARTAGLALLYGAGGAVVFSIFTALVRIIRKETIPLIAGTALFILIAAPGGYWARRLWLPPFSDPLTIAGIALAALAAGVMTAKALRRRRPRRTGTIALFVPPVLLALLALNGLIDARRPGGDGGKGPNILFITIDTLRDDHLPSYGYERPTAPVITRLADEGAVLLNAVSTAPFTQPATASLVTGLYPHTHGVRNHPNLLGDEHVTLAEALESEGYATAAFSSQGLLVPRWGFGQGFRLFENVGAPIRWEITFFGKLLHRLGVRRVSRSHDAKAVTDDALRWLDRNGEEPFFLWLHYLDPHFPYFPPEKYRTMFDSGPGPGPLVDRRWPDGRRKIFFLDLDEREIRKNIDLYDAEIRYNDDQIGRLIDLLEEKGIRGRTMVVVTSDHGESLGEHGLYFAHTHFLYEPSMAVPLVFSWPAVIREGTRVRRLVRTIDLMPTVLDLAGAAVPESVEGTSFAPLLRGDGPIEPRLAFGENGRTIVGCLEEKNPRWMVEGDGGRWRMVRNDDYKLILIPHEGENRFELYDLRADTLEANDIATERPALVDSLKTFLLDWIGSGTAESTVEQEIDEETMRALEALGYIQR